MSGKNSVSMAEALDAYGQAVVCDFLRLVIVGRRYGLTAADIMHAYHTDNAAKREKKLRTWSVAEIDAIARLKANGLCWREIGKRIGRPMMSVKTAYHYHLKDVWRG